VGSWLATDDCRDAKWQKEKARRNCKGCKAKHPQNAGGAWGEGNRPRACSDDLMRQSTGNRGANKTKKSAKKGGQRTGDVDRIFFLWHDRKKNTATRFNLHF